MGNYISNRVSDKPGKIILSDGTIHEFNQPITVAELMLDHPQHFVVELISMKNREKPTPLPADKILESRKVYLLLQMKQGKPISLSTDQTRKILSKMKASRPFQRFPSFLYAAKVLPLLASICQFCTCLGHEVVLPKKDGFVKELDKDDNPKIHVEIFEEGSTFTTRQVSSKGWKPTLVTIEEKAGGNTSFRRSFKKQVL